MTRSVNPAYVCSVLGRPLWPEMCLCLGGSGRRSVISTYRHRCYNLDRALECLGDISSLDQNSFYTILGLTG